MGNASLPCVSKINLSYVTAAAVTNYVCVILCEATLMVTYNDIA